MRAIMGVGVAVLVSVLGVLLPSAAQEESSGKDAKASLDKLKAEIEALSKQRQGGKYESGVLGSERNRLQQELKELLQRIESRPLPSPKSKVNEGPARKFEPISGDKPLDLLRSATNLFQDGDLDAALRTFRLIDTSSLNREDRAYVKYMTATCLRRTGRVSEAAALYREVAESRDDDFLAECAIWQLSLLRSTQELQSQLDRLRGKSK